MKHVWVLTDEELDPPHPNVRYTCHGCNHWFVVYNSGRLTDPEAHFQRWLPAQTSVPEDCDVAMCKEVLNT